MFGTLMRFATLALMIFSLVMSIAFIRKEKRLSRPMLILNGILQLSGYFLFAGFTGAGVLVLPLSCGAVAGVLAGRLSRLFSKNGMVLYRQSAAVTVLSLLVLLANQMLGFYGSVVLPLLFALSAFSVGLQAGATVTLLIRRAGFLKTLRHTAPLLIVILFMSLLMLPLHVRAIETDYLSGEWLNRSSAVGTVQYIRYDGTSDGTETDSAPFYRDKPLVVVQDGEDISIAIDKSGLDFIRCDSAAYGTIDFSGDSFTLTACYEHTMDWSFANEGTDAPGAVEYTNVIVLLGTRIDADHWEGHYTMTSTPDDFGVLYPNKDGSYGGVSHSKTIREGTFSAVRQSAYMPADSDSQAVPSDTGVLQGAEDGAENSADAASAGPLAGIVNYYNGSAVSVTSDEATAAGFSSAAAATIGTLMTTAGMSVRRRPMGVTYSAPTFQSSFGAAPVPPQTEASGQGFLQSSYEFADKLLGIEEISERLVSFSSENKSLWGKTVADAEKLCAKTVDWASENLSSKGLNRVEKSLTNSTTRLSRLSKSLGFAANIVSFSQNLLENVEAGDSLTYGLVKGAIETGTVSAACSLNPAIAVAEFANYMLLGDAKLSEMISPTANIGGIARLTTDIASPTLDMNEVENRLISGHYGKLMQDSGKFGQTLADDDKRAALEQSVTLGDSGGSGFVEAADYVDTLTETGADASIFSQAAAGTANTVMKAGVYAAYGTAKIAETTGTAVQNTIQAASDLAAQVKSWF